MLVNMLLLLMLTLMLVNMLLLLMLTLMLVNMLLLLMLTLMLVNMLLLLMGGIHVLLLLWLLLLLLVSKGLMACLKHLCLGARSRSRGGRGSRRGCADRRAAPYRTCRGGRIRE
jgi:hypothetical protein